MTSPNKPAKKKAAKKVVAKRKTKQATPQAQSQDKRKRGRPSEYRPEYAELARKFCLLGATDADLGRMFDVDERTINNWKLDHSGFFQSIKDGREVADAEVSAKLFHRARGYSHTAVKMFYDSKAGDVLREEYVEHYPPDTAAAIFWLKNRQKDRWRDRLEHGHGGLPGAPPIATAQIDTSKLTPDQVYAYVMNGGALPKESEQ